MGVQKYFKFPTLRIFPFFSINYIYIHSLQNRSLDSLQGAIMHLSSSSPWGGGGGGRAVGGGTGDFVGILQHICAPVVGE